MIKNKNRFWLWSFIGLACSFASIFLLVILFSIVGIDVIQQFDVGIQKHLYPAQDSKYYELLPLMTALTSFASFYYSFAVALTFACYYFLYRSRYLEGTLVLLSFFGMWGINSIAKLIIQRERPDLEYLIQVSGYSFPSGHAMVATGFYGTILLIEIYSLTQRIIKPLMLSLLGIFFIVIICFSRIYLGVHYPTDVLTGLISGGIWILAVNRILRSELL